MTVALWIFIIAWAVILYTYVGFPLALAAFARVFGEQAGANCPSRNNFGSLDAVDPNSHGPEGQDGALPRVAMVVAAFNEEAALEAKLANSWAIDYPADRFELWIGSDGSDDCTALRLLDCPDARLRARIFPERRGKISVLNDLCAEVEADILVMSDANTLYSPDAVRKLIAHFHDPRVGCVSGELSLTQNGGVSGEGLYWRYENWIKRNESRLGFLIGCNGGIFALRRECFESLPPSTIVEDFVITMRVLERGRRVVFEPEARACEPACDSSAAEMTRKVRIGAGGFQALGLTGRALHPDFGLTAFAYWGHKVLRWFVPMFFLAAVGAEIALSRIPAFGLLLAAQALGALVALAAYSAPAGLPRWTRPISYFYLMNYSLFCGFLRYVFRTQRVTWDRHAPGQPSAQHTSPSAATSLAE